MDAPYADTDLVYVDPEKRLVVGRVEWTKSGNAKPKLMPTDQPEAESAGGRVRRGPPRKRAYPWGSYRTMKKIYRLEGREPEERGSMPLEEAILRSSAEAFWD